MRILLSISIILIGFCSFAGVVVLDQNGQGDYTTFADALNNSSAGDTIYVVGSAASYGNISLSSPRTIIGNGYFGQSLGYQPSSTFGTVTLNAGAATSQFVAIETNTISFNESNISFISCYINGNSTIGASIANISFDRCYFRATLSVQGSGVSIDNSIFNIPSATNALTITGGVETQLSYVTFYDGNLSLDTAIVNNCVVNSSLVTQTPAIIVDSQFGNKVDTEANLLFLVSGASTDQFFQLQAGSSALTSSDNGAESGAFGFPAGLPQSSYILSGLPGIPKVTGLNYESSANISSNLSINVRAISDPANINEVAISVFFEGSFIETQTFNSFSPSTTIDEILMLNTSLYGLGMHSFSVLVTDIFGIKSILATGAFLMEELIVSDANVTDLEYFIDTDPGTGLSTQIVISPSSEISITENLNISGLSEGFHSLYLRAKDQTGRWGGYQSQTIYVESSVGVGDVVVIEDLEYFVDVDPGAGLGTSITASPSSEVALVESLNLSSLSIGFHTLFVRGKLTNGAWGPYTATTIYIESTIGVGDVVVIDELEYFIDTDPGAGLGTAIAASPASEISLNESISTAGLSNGFHTLYLRGKLVNGTWGPYTSQSIYVENSIQGVNEQIVALEYFFDVDPGVGLALVASGSTPAVSLNENVSLDASGLSTGSHTVSFRAKDEYGLWSHYQTQTIEVLAGSLVESIANGNWNDPGVWSTSTVPNAIDSVSIKNVITLNVPTDTVLALTIASSGTLDLNGNDVHVRGRFTAQSGSSYTANAGSLFMDGGSQTYTQEGIITHDNLIFGGTGTKTINYSGLDNLAIGDSLHIESGVSLAFVESNPLSLIGTADFVNEGSFSTANKWSLFLNGTSHIVDGGDFESVTIQTATTLNIVSDLNYDNDFDAGVFGSIINLGSNEINLGETWNVASSEVFNYGVGGRFRAEKSVVFSMEAEVPITIVEANSGTFTANGNLTFGTDQLLNIMTGIVTLNDASFSGSGGLSLSGGSLNVTNGNLTFGTGSFLANDGGTMTILGSSSISGTTSSDTYTFVHSSGSLNLDGTSISEVGGLGLALFGGTASLTNISFTNGLGVSYITFDDGFDGTGYDGIFFEPGPAFNVSINDGIAATVTFDQYGGSFGGPDFDSPGTTGTINWTNPQGLGTVTVLTPNGGESLTEGESFSITWSTENVPASDLIEISLSTNGGENYDLLTDGTFDTFDGVFNWTVPSTLGSDNLIQIVNTTQGIDDVSDALFSIVEVSTGAPVASTATNILSTSFQANWSNVVADKFFVDVSKEADFSSFVTNYENVEVGTNLLVVTGLDFKDKYYYRVRADNGGVLTDNSNIISVNTVIDLETIADSAALVQIYNALGGSSWSPAVNWTTARLRDWNGVELNSSRTRVEDISISGRGAIGDMPNPLTGDAVGGLTELLGVDLRNNQITGLMDFSSTSIVSLNVSGNRLQFDDLEPVVGITTVDYANQASIKFNEAIATSIKVRYTTNSSLSIAAGGSSNQYNWFINESITPIATNADFTVNGSSLDIVSIDYDNMGAFRAEVTNALVPNLTIAVDPQKVLAIADFEVRVLGADDQPIAENVFGALLEAFRGPKGFDTLEIALDAASTFTFPDVVLGNYLAAVSSDPEKYIGTYSGDEFLWENADTILFRNDDGLDLKIQLVPPPTIGDGKVSGTIETNFAEDGGRIDARRAAARRKCGLRRKGGGGRTDADDDGFVLIAYGETNDNGEFEYGQLPSGTYRFFVEYPGIPLDPDAFVQFEVGEAGISDTEFVLAATITENGIEVELIKELGVIFKYFKNLQVYPNPSNEVLNISYRHLTTDAVRVELVNLTGSVLMQQDLQRGYDRDLTLDVTEYKEGIYLLRFFDKSSREKNMLTYRIVIRH